MAPKFAWPMALPHNKYFFASHICVSLSTCMITKVCKKDCKSGAWGNLASSCSLHYPLKVYVVELLYRVTMMMLHLFDGLLAHCVLHIVKRCANGNLICNVYSVLLICKETKLYIPSNIKIQMNLAVIFLPMGSFGHQALLNFL